MNLEDQQGMTPAAQKYLVEVAAALTAHALRLEQLNTGYLADMAALVPGKTWPNGTPMTPQSLHGNYLSARVRADRERSDAIAAAKARFESACPGAQVPQLADGSAPSVPPVFPAPQGRAPEPVTQRAGTVAGAKQGLTAGAWTALILVGALILVVVWFAWPKPTTTSYASGSGSGTGHSATVDVLYEVEGTAKGTNVTLASPTGTVQLNDKAVPLGNRSAGTRGIHYTMSTGDFLYIAAQNTGDSGTIICRISIDGVIVASNTSSGAYAIATCKG